MKKILSQIGFHKADEMERHIRAKAQRNAFLFLVFALVIWTFYESYKVYSHHSRINLLPCMLLVGAVLVQGVSQLILTRNAVKDDEDSFETAPLLKIIILVCIIAGIIATAGAAFLLMGVRL